jgi:hypothetical protein
MQTGLCGIYYIGIGINTSHTQAMFVENQKQFAPAPLTPQRADDKPIIALQ